MKAFMLFLGLTLTLNLFAASKIEAWKNGEELVFVDRDAKGLFQGYGQLHSESWNDGDDVSEWVARRANGQLVTGYKGHLEKFKVAGMKKEQLRLVIRNKSGAFVTWKAVDELFTSGFESFNGQTVYVVRYNGKFVNWAKAHLESWSNYNNDVLVVRDTQDGSNNGKILSYIPAETMLNGQVVYRDPETGKFVSRNN